MPIIVDFATEVRPIAVSSLIYRAGLLLQDEEHVRWTTLELIEWINEAAGAVIRLKPSAGARRAIFAMESGSLQKLDDTVVQLIDVVRNIGQDDVTPGRAIRKAERHLLDSANPDWHAMKAASTLKHFIYDDRTPAVFYVYPPSVNGAKVEIMYAVLPEEVDSPDDHLDMNIEYADSILNYVLFRCWSKDDEYANANMANAYYQAFLGSMGAGDTGEQSATPSNKVPA
ncbi:hypothetical protein D3C76_48020 [compost metagenome]